MVGCFLVSLNKAIHPSAQPNQAPVTQLNQPWLYLLSLISLVRPWQVSSLPNKKNQSNIIHPILFSLSFETPLCPQKWGLCPCNQSKFGGGNVKTDDSCCRIETFMNIFPILKQRASKSE
jgi:hypothetical protein